MNVKIHLIDLAQRLSNEFSIPQRDAILIVEATRDFFIESIRAQQRIEIRGFGVIKYNFRPSGIKRNPKTDQQIIVPEKVVPWFVPSRSTTDISS